MNLSTFRNRNGLSIFIRSWYPKNEPRAMIIIIPGFNAHSGYYIWTAKQLISNGLIVHAIDLRGRGKSDGERFYVKKFDDYVSDVSDLIEIAKLNEPKLPVFLLGHSAGGVVSCLYAIKHPNKISGLICESFAFQVPGPRFALAVYKGLEHLAPHAHVLRLKNENFSRDPIAVETMNNDPLIAHETQPTQTIAEMIRADEKLKREFSKITQPIFILHGTDDKAVNSRGSQFFFDNVGSNDKIIKLYDGGYHDLLNDVGKEAVLSDILDWVNDQITKRYKVLLKNQQYMINTTIGI